MGSTDVKHSIAGFYYQVMLACKELALLLNTSTSDESYVAVEYGADVRIYDHVDIRMEAKFYNDNTFTRYKEAITHSMYNFFVSFKGAATNVRYRFKCNVPVNKRDLPFFTEWMTSTGIAEKVKYIKECFVYESIEKEPIVEGEYKSFRTYIDSMYPKKKRPRYKQALIKHLAAQSDPAEYIKYILPSLIFDDPDLERFIKQIDFDFPAAKVSKYESIANLKSAIDLELTKFNGSLTAEQRNKIMLLVLEAFLDSTVTVGSNVRTITVADCKAIVANHETQSLRHLNKAEYQELIQEIEQELSDYEYILRKNEYNEYVDDIMSILIGLKEQLHSEMDHYGSDKVLRRFVMSRRSYPIEVMRLFQSITEMMVKTNRHDESASVVDGEHLNNMQIGEKLHFSLRALPAARSARSDASLLMNNFIDHTQENFEISKAAGGETIIFDTENDICQLPLDEINNTVIDIFKVKDNKQHQEFYKSFRYRCTKCLKLSFIGKCPFLQELKGE
ncbi:hypothetical protein [Paenibacillus alginolyticus]|uniref:hypothetical protein n=1 Tax=Paenibacillus alginolyticus TaxID=59839 RepID=UPI002DBD55B1|nr:hypothetical protein [Paenibacillus alginolyticus]MEC0142713.1 hypothetical protein [Paenibacillus alginolyticus]